MIIMMSTLKQRAFCFFFTLAIVFVVGQNNLSTCQTPSPDALRFRCNENGSLDNCWTFAIFRANSYYSSLSNLSFYLGIQRAALQEANGFHADTEYLQKDQSFLIPIHCTCNGGIFSAELTKTTIKGESFSGIAETLEGLTTCKAIREKNPSISPWNLEDKLQLQIPVRCACPSIYEINQQPKFLVSYPVSQADTIFSLALQFNTTTETIVSVNNRLETGFKPENLVPASTLLIPFNKPIIHSVDKPAGNPNPVISSPSIPLISPQKRKSKMRKIGIYIASCGVVFVAIIAVVVAFLVIHCREKKKIKYKMGDVKELDRQQFGPSVETTNEETVSYEGSQDTLNDRTIESTPCKMMLEMYSIDELRKATEDFIPSNLIGDSVFHGRLNGKNVAVKRMQMETISKIDFGLFHNSIHHHHNIIRLYGTCFTDGPDSLLVFEYAKNGSLKDWLHGGLAMKSHFIASCYCFLTWNQRLRICLGVATALQYMHNMSLSYVHRNIKSRNIFLDEEFSAKIGNFGMASCVEDDTEIQQSYSSPSASWSKGYLAPEYLHQGTIAPSIDIFAYGVVLLEVLSGQTPITSVGVKGEGTVRLSEKIKLILQSHDAEELRKWMDNALGENYSLDVAVTLANLARACIEDDPSLRPNAGEIVEKLSSLVEDTPECEQQLSICESSCKPLGPTAATNV